MDYEYALAFALANDALSLFVGSGFSKHLTGGNMPGWQELLEAACSQLSNPEAAKQQFAEARKSYPLEDCAQILELVFLREGKDFRKALADSISATPANHGASSRVKAFLEAHPSVTIMTTNYDVLVEEFVLPGRCNSNYPGKPISRREGATDVFHIHGCVKNPSGMIATTNDYYSFINAPSYFAQKIATLMHENSMLIIGYSLSDPNLKAILNEFRSKEMRSINRGNLFFVSSKALPAYVRDYYETAYGLIAIEETEIDSLFARIEARFAEAKAQTADAARNLADVLAGTKIWSPEYLKLKDSLFHIIATANTIGIDIQLAQFRAMLEVILESKVGFTVCNGAWEPVLPSC